MVITYQLNHRLPAEFDHPRSVEPILIINGITGRVHRDYRHYEKILVDMKGAINPIYV